MRYLLYFLLLYLFLPFNLVLDLLAILLFFIIFNEIEWFALVFAFYTGLLIDLYSPSHLGLNALVYVILGQALLYIKRYIAKDLVTILMTFVVFFLVKIVVIEIAANSQLRLLAIVLTITLCLPMYLVMNKLLFRIWMKR